MSWQTYEDSTVVEPARRQGVKPIRSTDELIQPGMFDSDEELDQFLADLRVNRYGTHLSTG